MQNPDYHLTDSELLNKYGIGQCPSRGVLTMYVVVLYCVKNGYSIPIDEDRETLKDFFEDLLNRLPNNLGDALQNFLHLDVVCGTEELRWCYHLACDVPREEFLYEYPLILSVLCDQLHIPHDDLDRIKLEWAVKKHLCGAGIDYRYYTGSQDALSDFILGELIDLQYKPELVPQYSGVYDESLQIQVAEDWELNDYWDPAFCEENNVDVLRPRDFSEGLLHDLDRLYERGGFHAIFHYDEQISGNPFRCAVLKSLVENHFLEEVITDGHNIICVLGVYGGFDSVRYKFFNDTEIVDLEDVPNPVHYSFIEANEYFLYPSFYTDEKIDDEREFVALGEICDVDPNCMEELINDSKTYHTLPRYYFSNDLQEVFSNAESPKHYKVSMLLDVYRGPHLHINRKGDLILNKVAGYYMCPEEDSWALRIKDDIVSPEYLSYVIHHSENIRNKLTAFPPTEVLLKIKVPILKDRRKQDELISEYREKISSVVNTDAVYSVAVVGLTDCSDSDFSSWGLKATCYSHIQGDDGLLSEMEKATYSPDAIIVDAIVDSVRDRYKGLRELLSKVRSEDIPVYVYTDVEEQLLKDDLYDSEYQYIMAGRYYLRSGDASIEKLVRHLRDELDGEDNLDAQIRGEFVREFAAAEWLEQKFPKLNLVSALTFSLSQPNKSFTTLRGVLNSLYKAVMIEISNGSGLDQVKSVGMLPQLLREGKYAHNNQVVFVVKGDIMPLPLAVSLCYASQIVNGAVHEEDVEKMDVKGYLSQIRSEHLAYSVIRIVMDFILWLHDVNFEFDGYCESADLNELHSVNCSGVLQQAGVNEYFCETEDEGRIHVFVKGKARLGAEIEITQVKHETKLRDKYNWITHTWNYKKETE